MVSTTQLYPWVPSLTGRTVIRTILSYDDTSTSVETTPEREVGEDVSVDGGDLPSAQRALTEIGCELLARWAADPGGVWGPAEC